MSIGIAALINGDPILGYSVFLTPSSISTFTPANNGSYTTVPVKGTVTGGVGPWTYQWIFLSGDIYTINTPTSNETTFSASGNIDQFKIGTFKLTVTDLGNGNAEASAQITISVHFESP